MSIQTYLYQIVPEAEMLCFDLCCRRKIEVKHLEFIKEMRIDIFTFLFFFIFDAITRVLASNAV